MTHVCKVCKMEKPRISNSYGAAGSKRWVDSVGRRWNGRVCPDCHSKAMYEKKLIRLKKKVCTLM